MHAATSRYQILWRSLGYSIVVAIAIAHKYVSAHEFWIEPHLYQLKAGEPLQADIRVGQHFRGDAYVYLPQAFKEFNIHIGSSQRSVKGTVGDLPALEIAQVNEGLNIISYQSSGSVVTYHEKERFYRFIETEDLSWVLEAHKQRELPESGFSEVFTRYGKSLVQVGDVEGTDQRVGLPFEWVALTNPYKSPITDSTILQLWHKDKPKPDVQVSVFRRKLGETGKVDRELLRTDGQGKVSIQKNPEEQVLVNAVLMMEDLPQKPWPKSAVWHSLWASLTYANNGSN